MMRVNIFVRTLQPTIGGMEVHAHGLSEAGRSRGWKVNLIASDNLPPEIPSADVFFFNDLSLVCQLQALRSKYPTVRFILRSGGNDLWRFKGTMQVLMGNIDYLIVNSDFSYRRAIAMGAVPWRVVKLRGGVPDSDVVRLYGMRHRLRNEFDTVHGTEGRILLSVVCRMEKFKGVCELLVRLAQKWNPLWFLVLVGGGRNDVVVRDELKRRFLPSDYLHLGAVTHSEALETIAISDVLLSPSLECHRELPGGKFVHTETMGRTIMEAMALGIDIVATNVGGVAELVDEFPCAVRLASDVNDLVNILHKRPCLRFERSDGILSVYGWKTLVKKYERIFSRTGRFAFSLDYDGTLVGAGDDARKIAEYVRKLHGSSFVMLNTAREISDDLILFAKTAYFDCVIARNGLDIIDLKDLGRWRQWSRWVEEYLLSDNVIDDIRSRLEDLMESVKIRQTYPNSLVIRKDGESDASIRKLLSQLVKGHPCHVVESKSNYKLVHDLFGKAGAAAYVLKDLPGCRLVGAGDGMEDLDLISHCEKGFVPRPNEERKAFLRRVFNL